MRITVDIEPTNRCNAKCYFCPRDQTPHQGLLQPHVFEQALARAVEFRAVAAERNGVETIVSLCGLGEPLLNRYLAGYVRRVREEGFACSMSSNGALLDEPRARELLDAGVQQIYLNVGEADERYEEVYHLPWQRTHDNVVRFAELSEGRCDVVVVLVDHRQDPEHLAGMERYWRDRGISAFTTYEIINRGGALFVDHMEYESYSEIEQARGMLAGGRPPVCGAPFVYLFVGYDGQYYLCCSDWKKEVPLGSVFDTSFEAVTRQKLAHVESREPVCKTCNLDPVNLLTERLRDPAAAPGSAADFARAVREGSERIYAGVDLLVPPGSEHDRTTPVLSPTEAPVSFAGVRRSAVETAP